MAKSCPTTLIPDLNTQLHFRLNVILYITNIVFYSYLTTSAISVSISPTNIDDYLPSDDPNITNLMNSHYDCAKQHNLRQFTLLNVKQCTEVPSNIQHASVKARVYVRAKAKHYQAYRCVSYAKKERKICFQGSVKNRRVDRAVWNHNTMPLPGTLDPLECKNFIRHLNGKINKILNNLHYNKSFRLLEDHFLKNAWNNFKLLLRYIN